MDTDFVAVNTCSGGANTAAVIFRVLQRNCGKYWSFHRRMAH